MMARLRQKTKRNRDKAMTESTGRTQSRRIRVLPEQWERIENAARGTRRTANEFVIDLAMEALDKREWPRTEAEVYLLRSAMFTAQAMVRDMEKAGRQDEIEAIIRTISEVAPELPGETLQETEQRQAGTRTPSPGDTISMRRGKARRPERRDRRRSILVEPEGISV